MNAYEAYGKKATSGAAARLIGPIKTRTEARLRYADILAEMDACSDLAALEGFLAENRSEFAQFQAELSFFWEGDGFDFLGLEKEIERARARLDERLDLPRWDIQENEEEGTGQ